ncbi:putative FAT1-long-chain fatty acid transporter [Tilletiaria anomala UBC 951]|uniref:Very long-chain fatty acid transport protein n=1 Tax=Tilletiaria anomala (strain ATCC 24038 / CBS 436.72 / UBC 951) TaxID=1037660 RepID=A0A066VV22_TILAU|nr:putative FAT1-long-chain fatty acid transporter [Tilletiaria anomala UBC 951]KDN45582.1 putative FAT1-long-chain fatty acid transporter [Tilletiaria anomala UBC 951]
MAASSKLLNAAVGVAVAAYLDAKHGIGADLHLARAIGTASIKHKLRSLRSRPSLWHFFHDTAQKYPNDICYIYAGKSWSWKDVEIESRRIANYLISLDLQSGDRIAIFMGNSASFVILWLACLSANIVPAFINTSLTGKGLEHCINISKAKAVIFEPELESALAEVKHTLASSIAHYVRFDDGVRYPSEKSGSPASRIANALDVNFQILSGHSTKEIPEQRRTPVTEASPAALIYTSGTTGLPKAALCSHGRMGVAVVMWPSLNEWKRSDRIYTPMPLYHSSAAFLCVAASWYGSSTVIIGRKFSATRFWDEVRANNATVIQYIGEICRYLLAVPPRADDKDHNVRMAYGNGMRPDVWNRFRDRFGVPIISEFYASSEGNGALVNYNSGPFGSGGVGRFAKLASRAVPDYKIIRVDPISEDIYRDPKTGLCVECAPGESGEFCARIVTSKPHAQFQGYADNVAATQKKIAVDVLQKGDAWFRSGDLMKKDADGFFWFGDRMGDTFRWRSENVSTAEVSAALGEILEEANVYGVLVPSHDGRAGCAAIPVSATKAIDYKKLASHARSRLPKYAVPLFLRVVPAIEATGTVKQLKGNLRNEGIDPTKVGTDPLFWLPPGSDAYKPFTHKDFKDLKAGLVKL